MTELLETHRLMKRFGAMAVTSEVSLTVKPGEIHAVIGPNGAGKTTLISQIAGELKPDEGSIIFDGREITRLPAHARSALGIARVFQLTSLFPGYTALENVLLAYLRRCGHGFRFLRDARTEPEHREACLDFLNRVDLGARSDTQAGRLSHGEQRQIEIAMVLAARSRLLLLDEPTAGMGPEETERMVALLSTLKGRHAMLLVEHDMDAVYRLADRVTVLVYGRVIASGTVNEIRSDPGVRKAYLGDSDE